MLQDPVGLSDGRPCNDDQGVFLTAKVGRVFCCYSCLNTVELAFQWVDEQLQRQQRSTQHTRLPVDGPGCRCLLQKQWLRNMDAPLKPSPALAAAPAQTSEAPQGCLATHCRRSAAVRWKLGRHPHVAFRACRMHTPHRGPDWEPYPKRVQAQCRETQS